MFIHLLKKASIVLLALNFSACSGLAPAAPTPSTAEVEKEEQAVYNFFLPDSGGLSLILAETSSDIPSDNPQQSIDYIKSGLKDISRETVNSFLERNAQPGRLSANMDLGVKYKLLSTDELKEISSQPDWGEVLTQKYPNSHGYTIFSRVGFNNSLDQAVIYVGNMAGPLMGSGSYFLMEKQNAKWIMKQQVMAWIS